MPVWLPMILLLLSLNLDFQDPKPGNPESAPEQQSESHVADPKTILGKPAPPLVLKDIDGKSFDLSKFCV